MSFQSVALVIEAHMSRLLRGQNHNRLPARPKTTRLTLYIHKAAQQNAGLPERRVPQPDPVGHTGTLLSQDEEQEAEADPGGLSHNQVSSYAQQKVSVNVSSLLLTE